MQDSRFKTSPMTRPNQIALRRDTIGSSLAACRAGITPKQKPIPQELAIASTTATGATLACSSLSTFK